MSEVKIKRIYDPAEANDGFRVLVDRLWPRGIAKAKASIDAWLKEAGPSTELRKWFGHDPVKWKEFQTRYAKELKGAEALKDLVVMAKKHKKITLLFGAKDEEQNQAVVLQKIIKRRLGVRKKEG
jgi:uncharacterized protein YeaO (DUF488 family)